MKSTFSVIYYLKRQVVKKDGTVPVMGRITVDGSQTQFSCKLTVDPKLWDTKGGRVTGKWLASFGKPELRGAWIIYVEDDSPE